MIIGWDSERVLCRRIRVWLCY